MSLDLLTDPAAVRAAMDEYDELGAEAFLAKYGFGRARSYFLTHDGRRYDSKAIAGAAVGKQYPDRGPLRADEFAGGDATVKSRLESLGFSVEQTMPTREVGDPLKSTQALELLTSTWGEATTRTAKLAAWRTPAGRELVLQLDVASANIWTEVAPPQELGVRATKYPGDKSRHSNIKGVAPRLAQPFEAWLSSASTAAALEALLNWYGGLASGELDASELEAMRAVFLGHMKDFVSFSEPGEVYKAKERAYKDELCELFQAEVMPLANQRIDSDERAAGLTNAFLGVLTRKLPKTGSVQDLVNWRYVDRLKKADAEARAAIGRGLADLIGGDGTQLERMSRFLLVGKSAFAGAGEAAAGDTARVLGSCALMLGWPKEAILVRVTLFDTAMKRLARKRLPSNADELGRFKSSIEFAHQLKAALEAWGWSPRDLIDAQSFLWVALMWGSDDGATTHFAEHVTSFIQRFAEVRTGPFSVDQELWATMDRVKAAITELPSVQARPDLVVDWSLGQGGWVKVPWIALLDQRVTTSTQEGTYVVFLVSEDLSRIYLTLEQGMTALVNEEGQSGAVAKMLGRAAELRARLGDLQAAGFSLDNQLDLNTSGRRTKNYEAGAVGYLEFPTDALPNDLELNEAMEAALSAYEKVIETSASAPSRPVWFVGAVWDGEDQCERFLAEAIWENGYDQGPTLEQVRRIQPGDRIAIKAAYTRKNALPFAYPAGETASVMKIKATGVVTANHGDGRRLSVAWNPDFEPREWYFWTQRETVWEVTPGSEFADKLIAFTFDGAEQDFVWFLNQPYWRDRLVAAPAKEAEPYSIDDAMKGLFLGRDEFERILSIWRGKKNLVLQGAPGVGKSFVARRLAYALMGFKDDERVANIQFHQSYGYEDFIQGYRPTEQGGFKLQDGVFYRFCESAHRSPDRPHVFIIDEINRGNLSKIFGELMLLIESDKRDAAWALKLAYAPESADPFFVPENLFILGMMNTADRSLSMVDYALRRRFAFVGLDPNFDAEPFRDLLATRGVNEGTIQKIISGMNELNSAIAEDKVNLGPGFRIGHSFFTPTTPIASSEHWFETIVETEIRPLLEEYWFDDPSKAAQWRERLLSGQ